MTDYYDDAFRVTRDSVPCRVFHKGAPAGHRELIKAAAKCGVEIEALEGAPRFTFTPSADALARGVSYRASAPTIPKDKTGYYDGYVRVLVHGVPCRLARDSKNYSKAHWSKPEPVTYGYSYRRPEDSLTWSKRAEEFRQELIAKGSYAAAGVAPPPPAELKEAA